VRTCLLWARDNGVPLAAQSGGHSYGGYSTTSGLLISVRPMGAVTFDHGGETATIGAGAQLGHLYPALFAEGVFVPAGRCASVGIAGYLLGGGFGFETRRYGLACDRLVETQLVTADGTLLTCSETENADLFWACRGGGGGNFGINTSFTLRTTPVVDLVYGKAAWRFEDAEAVWSALQRIAITAPDGLGMRNGIERSRQARGAPSTDSVTADFMYFGSEADARDLLAPALNAASPTEVTFRTGSIADATDFVAEASSPNAFLAKSAYAEVPMPDQGVSTLVDAFRDWPNSARAVVFALHSVGGVSNGIDRTATAYVHRSAQAAIEYEIDWFNDASDGEIADHLGWVDVLDRALRPYFNGEAYQNFIDPTLQDWQQAYYAENFDRLVAVKRRYDPANLFNSAQGIPV
jgi:FAD/FMN-containing dehydrogenase